MTNLSRRVLKAKGLNFRSIPGAKKSAWGTNGSSGRYNYQIFLSSKIEDVNSPNHPTEKMNIPVLLVECYRNSGTGTVCDCKGNSNGTVCYHGLGAVHNAYNKLSDKRLSFYEDFKGAVNGLNFGGKLAKVKSKQGQGVLWAVIRDIKENKNA